MLKSLPIGAGVNLDADDSTVQDGSAVAYYNCYLDRLNAVRRVPGMIQYADLGVTGEVFKYYSKAHSMLILVCSGRVWRQTAKDGALDELTGGSFTAGTPPSFAEDGEFIFFVANSQINGIDPASTVITVGPTTPRNVTSLVYIGGYLVCNGDVNIGTPVAGDTHYSDDKAGGYAIWEFYNNQSNPDGLQALLVANEQVYNIGASSLEVTFIDGTVPFSVNKNVSQKFGTMAPYSAAYDGANIYYLSEADNSRAVLLFPGGGSPQIISFPVDIPIESFETVSDARGYTIAFKGQHFYVLDFPSAAAVVDDQLWTGITLAYHVQGQRWLILGRWDSTEGIYDKYRGCSFCYVEPWGLRLVGGRDGKAYKLYDDETIDYDVRPTYLHRWRDDGKRSWGNARQIDLGKPGDTTRVSTQTQCGMYRLRQHQFVFSDQTDAGEIFRLELKTGNISYGIAAQKTSAFYRYNVKRGSNDFVLNGIEEEIQKRGR